ncbi:MAG: type I-U CRISPR-associated protein Cas5/Cas6, partial [Armatimonadota bacterium]
MPALVLYVRLHDGRYHGEGDWPPSPARLFQALVAGAGISGPLKPSDKEALEWLEKLPPPIIAAPCAQKAERGVTFYMPNNDSDAIGGDPLKISKIRTATKVFRPWFFDAAIPFVYVWRFDGNEDNKNKGDQVCSLAKRLYQLGRGIDMAWAWGEILEDHKLDDLLANHPGPLLRPSAGKSALTLPCPCPGSLRSLELRHGAFGERFAYEREGRSLRAVFRRPPRPV